MRNILTLQKRYISLFGNHYKLRYCQSLALARCYSQLLKNPNLPWLILPLHAQLESPHACSHVRWKTTVEDMYQMKTQLEHILLRPDTYIGSVEKDTKWMWVPDNQGKKMIQKEISYVPGLYKIFDEILVNAADNKINDKKMTCIKIDIDSSENMIRIWNDGRGIPVVKHKKYKMYIPTLIFGHLLTSSNYDDTMKRITGGRHGFGAKLCNIFSSKFVVETSSKKEGLHFQQTWTSNMTQEEEPVIKEHSGPDFTCVTFYPDLAKFGVKKINKDLLALFTRRAYDVSATVNGIQVILNGKTLPISNFKDYVNMYVSPESGDDSNPVVAHKVINSRWEVAVTPSDDGFRQTSFVNSIYTERGGTHVKLVTDNLVEPLTPIIMKKSNFSETIKPSVIKNQVWVFVNCLIENPTFDMQTKETLTLQSASFGSTCEFTKSFIDEIEKTGLVQRIIESVEKTLRRKVAPIKSSGRIKGITKLEDATDAGTKQSHKCTLIITEGDSAKATALAGLSVIGRKHFGVFPVTGKLLNVRQTSMNQIVSNAQVQNIIKILGLHLSEKYESEESAQRLRYGKIMIMADQDEDGSHIKGLIINLIHFLWPNLLNYGFIAEFKTPLIKVTRRNTTLAFYSNQQFNEWKQTTNNWPSWTVKYYKGLGTSTSKEAKEYFRDIGRHEVGFVRSGIQDDHQIDLVFGDKADKRKDWISQYFEEKRSGVVQDDIQDYMYKQNTNQVTYSDFVNRELIHFATLSLTRAIPCMVDGLKVSQRKIIYTCLTKKYTQKEVKVMQMAASVAAHTSYHHGENSLMQAIITLAQDFVGSNNVNLLLPIGQFGTRLTGGKDAASPRYIFTKMSPLGQLAFNEKDFPLLEYVYTDNQWTEPVCYYPIIPLILVNGALGIATGWSTKIPNYCVRDIVENLFRMINGEKPVKMIPSYKHFLGRVEESKPNQFKIYGRIKKINKKEVVITEIPVGVWTQTYKENVLEAMLDSKKISKYMEEHTDKTVRFVVQVNSELLKNMTEDDLLQYFKLEKNFIPNMVLLDESGVLKTYNDACEILEDFFELRLTMYEKRKQYMEDFLQAEWLYLSERARFVMDKIEGNLKLENKKLDEVTEILKAAGYQPDPLKTWRSKNLKSEPTDEQSTTDTHTPEGPSQNEDYSYLLNLPIYSLTYDNKAKLHNKVQVKEDELNDLKAKSVRDLWIKDLNEFMTQWEKEELQAKEEKEEENTHLQSSNG